MYIFGHCCIIGGFSWVLQDGGWNRIRNYLLGGLVTYVLSIEQGHNLCYMTERSIAKCGKGAE